MLVPVLDIKMNKGAVETRPVQIMLVSLVQKITNFITGLPDPVSDIVKKQITSCILFQIIMRRFLMRTSILQTSVMRMFKSGCSVCDLHSRIRNTIRIESIIWLRMMRVMI